MKNPVEIITANEALRRVGCASLARDWYDNILVDWTGIPTAFACGHTRFVHRGEGSTEIQRVNQAHCSGGILYNWTQVGGTDEYRFHLGAGFCVSVDKSGPDMFLRACVTG